jgi:hypothetical protein
MMRMTAMAMAKAKKPWREGTGMSKGMEPRV